MKYRSIIHWYIFILFIWLKYIILISVNAFMFIVYQSDYGTQTMVILHRMYEYDINICINSMVVLMEH
jgi:hypothetical protein